MYETSVLASLYILSSAGLYSEEMPYPGYSTSNVLYPLCCNALAKSVMELIVQALPWKNTTSDLPDCVNIPLDILLPESTSTSREGAKLLTRMGAAWGG